MMRMAPKLLLIALTFCLLAGVVFSLSTRAQDAGDGEAADAAEENTESSAVEGPEALRNPRATMRTFITAVNNKDLDTAVKCLDFSALEKTPTTEEKRQLARRLMGLLDRMARVEYNDISDDPKGSVYRFPPEAEDPPIAVARNDADGAWRFTAETVASIDTLWEEYKDKPLVVNKRWWRTTYILKNEVWRPAALFLSLLGAWILGVILRSILRSTGERLKDRNRPFLGATVKSLARAAVPFLLVVGLKIGLAFLLLNPVVSSIAQTCTSVLFALAVGWAVYCLVDVVDARLRALAEGTESKLDDMLAPMVCTTLRATVVILVLIQIGTILSDKPMTSILAGLGVGGLAIGLAAQDMIKNFFGSLMIFGDRPFELGDRIVVNDHDGTVEVVGFRSTRIRTLDGHLVTIPNGVVANADIKNITKRPNIKRAFDIGVTYDTPPEKVRRAKEILEELLKEHEGMDPDTPPRIYFSDFLDSALNIKVVYWYHPANYWDYCDFSERLNLEILERFNNEGIEFAFPSQSIYLAGQEHGAA